MHYVNINVSCPVIDLEANLVECYFSTNMIISIKHIEVCRSGFAGIV